MDRQPVSASRTRSRPEAAVDAPAREVADDWEAHWASFAESATANPAQEYRRRLIFRWLGITGSGRSARILDVGSGQGDMLVDCARHFGGAALVGLELSEAGIGLACKKLPQARFVQRNLLAEGEPPSGLREWATHALCSEVIEHVDDPVKLLNNAAAFMAHGCRLVVTVPGGPMSAYDRHIGHRRHYSSAGLRGVLEAAGFTVEQSAAAGYPFFNLYRLVVLLRGEKLIDDARQNPSRPARIAMGAFRLLFRFNLFGTPWGWQIVAGARKT